MTFGKVITGVAVAAFALSGCVTSSVTKVSEAAPITYKMGEGVAQYASLGRSTAPSRIAPAPYTPVQPVTPAPLPRAGSSFDQASVDKDLYKHQRVGKRYTVFGKSYTPKHQPDYDVTGTASWYGDKFHGKPTATGEKFDKHDLTAAHKTLPLNSMLMVTNVETGATLMVRLNDRGPFVGDRIIDLSQASAEALGLMNSGLGKVRVQYAGPADPMAATARVPVRPAQPVPMEEFVEAPAPAPSPMPQPVMPYNAPPVAAPAPAPVPQYVAPGAPRPTAPATPDPEGEVTLTIKGPIHVAGYDGTQKPRLIRERLTTK